jgi:ATP-dependent RNA helicase HrpA
LTTFDAVPMAHFLSQIIGSSIYVDQSLKQLPLKQLSLEQLRAAIKQCMLVDRDPLLRKWKTLEKRTSEQKPVDRLVDELAQRIERSACLVKRRGESTSQIQYPDLPIADKRDEIAAAIAEHQVVVIAGETGSGKTTQLPKICLQLGRGVQAMIGHTQPRRLAASTVAQRIADELRTTLGDKVGYQVRFTDQVSETSNIKLMTDGILLAEVQRDRLLKQYDTIIIDEAHERSLNIDFLLGYFRQLLPKRPDLKLIITSATIDVDRFSKHFHNAPVIEVSGRTYPVETLYRPLSDLSEDGDLAVGIQAAIEEVVFSKQRKAGDVLVFLSAEAEIREVSQHLRKANWDHCEILPLYARLNRAEQNKVFSLSKRRGTRIVLATNVAETSLTVPGIRYVIDPGFARISRYSYRTKIQRLPIEAISQASANQRKGRCGRVSEGVCIRLYDQDDFEQRPEFTDPEIQRTNLASVILQMLSMRIGEVERFPFVDPPDRRMIGDGFKLLEELGAVDDQRRLTSIGRALGRFPIDPRLSRQLIAAQKLGSLREVLIIVSALSIQDPRERPAEKRQASDEKHRRFWEKESDFLTWVNLWEYYEQQRQALSQSQLRKLCQREYLAFMRMREWRDIHRQLRITCKELGFKENDQSADFESVHRALLAGLLSHTANLNEEREYLGARNRKLRIFPGSALAKKTPKWIVAADIAQTTQVFARCCASIQPQWLFGINDSLLKRTYSEPHWHQRSARVMAFESVSLYGLVIRERQRVHYGPINESVSRELFIRGALVEGRLKTNAAFFIHNQQLVKEIEQMEAKTRRRDILVNDEQLFEFYNERLGAEITTFRRFEQWRKETEHQHPQCLFMSKAQLMQHSADQVSEAQFPASINVGDLRFNLSYRFEPGHDADGVTVTLPLVLLNRVPRHRFEWLVPGLLRDKCIALVKLLPKSLRKQLVPVPDYIDKALTGVVPDDSALLAVLSRQLRTIARVTVDQESWSSDQLDDFYKMNYRVVDAEGKTVGQGRDLNALLKQFKGQVTENLQQQTEQRFQVQNIRDWEFGELPETHRFDQAGVTVTSYPALVDCKESVSIELMDFPEQALLAHQQGLVRLFMLQMPQQIKYLKKELLRGNTINLQLAAISERRELWLEGLLRAVFFKVFVQGGAPLRDKPAFMARLEQCKGNLIEQANEFAQLLSDIAKHYSDVRKSLKKANELAWAGAVRDVNQQLSLLFQPGFIVDTPWYWLQQYPRYLQAISRRLEKLRGHFQRDKQLAVGLASLFDPLRAVWKNNQEALLCCEQLLEYRWLLEEYRVSLFAQQLGTLRPVSEKRMKEQWKPIKQLLVQ